MAGGDLANHLPAWLWGKDKDGQWKTLDSNSASDADVWMAYTLVEAGRLWKEPSYTSLGRRMMAQIAKREVVDLPGFGLMLLPAPVGFQHETTWTLNSSYLPLFVFERLGGVDPAGPWRKIAANIPRFVQQSSSHGFAMDWTSYTVGQGFHPAALPSQTAPTEKEKPFIGGSYDAVRVYLWAGMIDARDRKRVAILGALQGMKDYLVNHDSPPEKIDEQGNAVRQDGPVGFSAAVLPVLKVWPQMEKSCAQQEARLSAQKDSKSGLYGKDPTYYDQNLALFATGFVDGKFRFGQDGELIVEWSRS
jgi:endoglucanase